MIPIYEHFSREWKNEMDYSDEMLLQLYEYESKGIGHVDIYNGFAHGKKILDITIKMWKEDLGKTLSIQELYEDENIPNWFVDKIMKKGIFDE